jgi:hypothetical protein
MEQTAPTINSSYRFQSRLKGEVELQLFNDFYLSVKERPLQKTRKFKMEIATLNPKAVKKEELAVHWLAAAVIAALGGVFFLYTLFSGSELLMALVGTLIAAGISAAFTAMYFYHSERKWVVETRNALYPLVVVPYHKSQQKEAQAFIEALQQAIERNVSSKRYNSEDLFVGELRMLRRLTNNKILSDTLYNQAKTHMMKSHGSATAA